MKFEDLKDASQVQLLAELLMDKQIVPRPEIKISIVYSWKKSEPLWMGLS